MSDTLQLVVMVRNWLASMLLEPLAPQRQTEVCRTFEIR
jgi:hypothetical protein